MWLISRSYLVLKLPSSCWTAQAEASIVSCRVVNSETRTASGIDKSMAKKNIPNLTYPHYSKFWKYCTLLFKYSRPSVRSLRSWISRNRLKWNLKIYPWNQDLLYKVTGGFSSRTKNSSIDFNKFLSPAHDVSISTLLVHKWWNRCKVCIRSLQKQGRGYRKYA